jgi:DnaJ-domain-containing protein 1
MTELARGKVSDRPWGRTLSALASRGLSGQLTITSDGKQYAVAFAQGAVVGSYSPLANDAAVRVALTGNLVTSTQVSDITRRLAATPNRDEVDVIAEAARLPPEHTQRLRRRVVAQRAARTFAVEQGEFVVEDRITVPVVAGSELDVRAIIYMGARANITEARLEAEVASLGAWFQIKKETIADLPQFGFTETERPVLSKMLGGADLVELLASATSDLDVRAIRSVVYALVSWGGCDVDPNPRGRGLLEPRTRTQPSAPPPPSGRPADGVPHSGSSRVTIPPVVQPPAEPPPSKTPTLPMGSRTFTRPPAEVPVTKPPTQPPFSRTLTPPMPEPPEGMSLRSPTGPMPLVRGSTGPIPTVAPNSGSGPVHSRTPTPGSGPVEARTPTPGSGPIPSRTPTPITGKLPLVTAGSGPHPRVSSTQAPPNRIGTQPPPNRTGTTVPPRQRSTTAAQQETEKLIAELVPALEKGDYFGLLALPFDAPVDAVRTSYFSLARKLHPDRLAALGIDDPQRNAQRLFAQINTAFGVLTDANKRKEYLAVAQRGGEAAVKEEESKVEEAAMKILRAEDAFRQGEMALRREQYSQAVQAFTTAVELHPQEPEYQALLAWAKFASASDKAAVASQTRTALSRAADASDTSITARFYLGRVERMLGREKEALSHFQMVLMLKPGHSEASSEVRILEKRLRRR